MCHVGNVYAHFPVAVLEFLDRDGVVEILGVFRVDGKRGHAAHVAPACNLFFGDALVDFLGGLNHLLGVFVGQTEFSEDGMDFGIVLAGHAQHIDYFAHRAVGVLRPFHNACHGLVAGLASLEFVDGYENVGSQEFAVGGQMGKIFLHLQCAYEHLLFGLDDFKHFGLGFESGARSAYVHQHAVAVEGVQ